jgi:archaellum component FlaC
MKTGNEESKPIEGVEQITSQTIDLSSLTDQKVREIYKEELSKDIDNLHRYVENVKKDFLTFFGLFASFMAFLSIEIQIFKSRDDWRELLGVTCLTLAFIGYFAILLMSVTREREDSKAQLGNSEEKKKITFNWQRTWPVIFTFLFSFAGVLLLLYDGATSAEKAIAQLEKKISKETERSKSDSLIIGSLKQNCDHLQGQIEKMENDAARFRNDIFGLDDFYAKKFGTPPMIDRYGN